MKNSIFKTYSKKILKSEAVISVIIVFVLALGIIGTSYALYMDVDIDTDYQLVEVGDLRISFDNIDNSTNPSDYNKIELSNLMPLEDEDGVKQSDNIFSFRIYNTGTYAVDYDIKLVTVDGNAVDPKYINFQLCKNDASNCGDIQTLSKIQDSIIEEDTIQIATEGSEASIFYFLRIWINNQYSNSTNDNAIKLRVMIEANNASDYLSNENTLAYKILNNPKIKLNNTTPDFSVVATEEEGLYKAPDDYGTSYYFRGAQSNNFVSFAGFTWRIVRINGDGSVRLILDGTLDKVSECNHSSSTIKFCTTSAFKSSPYNDNAYMGYMSGIPESTDYASTHKNINDSTIKTKVDAFYEVHLASNEKYLADTLFCGDKTRAKNYTTLGTGTTTTYYSSYDRLYRSVITPSLECTSQNNDTDSALTEEERAHSRYTSKLDNSTTTIKGVLVNNDLKYPIALLSADEIAMAGAYQQSTNKSYYLYKSTLLSDWWLMTPSYYNGNLPLLFNSQIESAPLRNNGSYLIRGVRPVINLKPTVEVTGEGTSGVPYTIKES